MSKILLIDIDGTLVDYENRLPASAVEAMWTKTAYTMPLSIWD